MPASEGHSARTQLLRAAFALVFAWNVLCALQFVIAPASFAGAYQLSGAAGEAAVRGMGVAFFMWNATYPAFIVHPQRFRPLGVVVLVQQAIGFLGEAFILLSLPDQGFQALSASIMRFMAFDGAGFVLMATAYWFCFKRASA